MNDSQTQLHSLKERFLPEENITLLDSAPILFMHLVCLAIPLVGVSWVAVVTAFALYILRVFALTGGYHRYFSHRAFKTSRVFQFVLAFLGATAAQLGPLWWASHHRHHHEHSDKPTDVHSPRQRGVFWAHLGWLLCRKYASINERRVQDWMRYPELRLIDRFHVVPPLILAASLYGLGYLLAARRPELNTGPWQMVVWGFFVSTVAVYHATFCINSLCHVIGRKRFETNDDSRNSLILALLTMGEGWHNNHHRFPPAARQGLFWWEIDLTYYILLALEKLHLIHDLKQPPAAIYAEAAELRKRARAG